MEQTECSETSAYKIQTPGNYPEENIQQTVTKFVQATSNKKPRTESKTRTSGINQRSKCNQNNVSDNGKYNIYPDNERIILRTLKLNVVNKQPVGRQNIRWKHQVKEDKENRVQRSGCRYMKCTVRYVIIKSPLTLKDSDVGIL